MWLLCFPLPRICLPCTRRDRHELIEIVSGQRPRFGRVRSQPLMQRNVFKILGAVKQNDREAAQGFAHNVHFALVRAVHVAAPVVDVCGQNLVIRFEAELFNGQSAFGELGRQPRFDLVETGVDGLEIEGYSFTRHKSLQKKVDSLTDS